MKHHLRVAMLINSVFNKLCGVNNFPIAFDIAIMAGRPVGGGRSSYARRRRAESIGRCHRCYRLWPPTAFTTRCDNKTCVPGISFNERVKRYILEGVTEVIPSHVEKKKRT
ncbi:nucleic acid binding protein [Phlox virus M]|uniref:RNA silencing suppressor n=1 Tax=Phlox virus M TaxID=437470 RepID=B6DRY8_9VIRU|nr:nucleic acid binding protein [Phlox virus M]ACI06094.1 nucleic acid binding protein [Phlox virus M]